MLCSFEWDERSLAHAKPFMALHAQPPALILQNFAYGEFQSFLAVPARLQQPIGLGCLCCYYLRKEQICGFMHNNLELVTRLHHIRSWWLVSLR